MIRNNAVYLIFTLYKITYLVNLTLFKFTGKVSDLSDSYNCSYYTAKNPLFGFIINKAQRGVSLLLSLDKSVQPPRLYA